MGAIKVLWIHVDGVPAEKTRQLQSVESNPWVGQCLSHSLYSENTGKSKEEVYIISNLTFQIQSCVQVRL